MPLRGNERRIKTARGRSNGMPTLPDRRVSRVSVRARSSLHRRSGNIFRGSCVANFANFNPLLFTRVINNIKDIREDIQWYIKNLSITLETWNRTSMRMSDRDASRRSQHLEVTEKVRSCLCHSNHRRSRPRSRYGEVCDRSLHNLLRRKRECVQRRYAARHERGERS